MFSYSISSFDELQEPQDCCCFEWCSRWCCRQTQRLREFFRRVRRSSIWEIRSSSWDYEWRWKWTEEDNHHTPESSTSTEDLQGFKAERALALRRNQICPSTPSREELLEQQVEELVPALLCMDDLSIFQFMETYIDFGTTEEVLDLLFAKYRSIEASPKKGGIQMRWDITMSSFLSIWLEYYEEDFDDPPEFPALTKLMNFTGQYFPDSTLDRRVNSYFEYLRNLHQPEFEGGDDTLSSDPEQHPEPPQECAQASTVGPAEPSGSQGMELVPAAGAEGSARGLTPAAVYKVRHVVVRPLNPCPELEEPPAPLGALEAERAPPPAIEVINVPKEPRHSGEQRASDPEQQPEPPQEPARAPTLGPAAPSRAQGKELVPAGGAEGSAGALMPAAVYKARHVVVRPLNPCPDPEEPPAPLGALGAERAPPPAIKVIDVPEQPPHSGEQLALDPGQYPEPPRQEPARGRLWGLLKFLGLR